MKCSEAIDLFSESIDNSLDRQKSAAFKSHLEDCLECRTEYLSMKAMVNELGSMKTYEARKGFLTGVHERIETGSPFNKIFRSFLYPPPVRIPFKLAGLAATAIIIFTFFNLVQPGKLSIFKSKENINTVNLLLKVSPVQKPKPLSSDNVVLVASGNGETRSHKPRIFAVDKELPQKDTEPGDPVLRINEMVLPMNGRILNERPENNKILPRYVTVEIPGIYYNLFVKKINNIGSITSPIPEFPDGYENSIQIRLEIISEE